MVLGGVLLGLRLPDWAEVLLQWVVGLGRCNIAIIKAASGYGRPAVQGKNLSRVETYKSLGGACLVMRDGSSHSL